MLRARFKLVLLRVELPRSAVFASIFSEPQHFTKADLHGSNALGANANLIAEIPEGRINLLVGAHQLFEDAIGRCKEVCGRTDRRLQGRRSGGLTLTLDLPPLAPVEI